MPKPPAGDERLPKVRSAVLKAAMELFARSGYYGARMDEIAAVSGINKAHIYRAFVDKHTLYQTVIGELRERVRSGAGSLTPLEVRILIFEALQRHAPEEVWADLEAAARALLTARAAKAVHLAAAPEKNA